MTHSTDAVRALPLYVSTRANSQLLCALLVLTAATHWIAAGYDLGEVRLVDSIQGGVELESRQRVAHAETGRLLGAAQLGCTLVVATLFLPWLFHARVNVRALGTRRLRFGREWAYLGFLIPGLNLFRPYQVMSEVFRASDPSSNDPLAWQRKPTPGLVLGWWLALVSCVAVHALSALLIEHAAGLPRVQLAHALSLAGNGFAALSTTLTYFIVSQVSRGQEAKWQAYGDASVPVTTLSQSVAV